MNIAEWLWSSAHSFPAAPALQSGVELEASYAGFACAAEAVAKLLADEDVTAGDRVLIALENSPAYLALLYGIWWHGAVVVPVNVKLHASEIAWIAENSEAALLLAEGELAGALADCSQRIRVLSDFSFLRGALVSQQAPVTRPAGTNDDELAWLFYTSGTTGRPKGAMLSHGNLRQMALCYCIDVDSISTGDAALYVAPMSHGAGLYSIVFTRCAARHLTPASSKFDPAETLALARSSGPVSFFAVPTMINRLVDEARRTGEVGDGIKTIVYGGAPMYLADMERAISVLGDRFVQIYGQGETPMTITSLDRCEHRPGSQRLQSVGRAQSVIALRITRADGSPAARGEIGEIEVKGPTVMLGYWKNREATDAAIVDGWLRTGDLGSLDEHGYLSLADRSKDTIISGGSNIYPREVEEVLLRCSGVEEVAVIGLPDRNWGEVVVACVVGSELECTRAALDDHCKAHIARYKRPKHYVFLEALPKSGYGKVLRRHLRESIAIGEHTSI